MYLFKLFNKKKPSVHKNQGSISRQWFREEVLKKTSKDNDADYFSFLRDAYTLINFKQSLKDFMIELDNFIQENIDDECDESLDSYTRQINNMLQGKKQLTEGSVNKERFINDYFLPLVSAVETDAFNAASDSLSELFIEKKERRSMCTIS